MSNKIKGTKSQGLSLKQRIQSLKKNQTGKMSAGEFVYPIITLSIIVFSAFLIFLSVRSAYGILNKILFLEAPKKAVESVTFEAEGLENIASKLGIDYSTSTTLTFPATPVFISTSSVPYQSETPDQEGLNQEPSQESEGSINQEEMFNEPSP